MSELQTHSTTAFSYAAPARPKPPVRDKFIGFARDEATATTLHGVLAPHLTGNAQVHVADFRAALTLLGGMNTPEIILIDLAGEDQPLNAMMELADVVESGTIVLAIGEVQNVNFYRTVTKRMGIKDYLPKPLDQAAVTRAFLPYLLNPQQPFGPARGGRMVSITGARGGVGTSTVAANLAWLIGAMQRRHTVLIDAELQTGTIALNFNLPASKGIGHALAMPERVDQLLIERSVQDGGERLHVLAGNEAFDKTIDYQADSGTVLVRTLRARYNFIVADTGAKLQPFARDLMSLSQQRVIIMDPTLLSIRNVERLFTLPAGPEQAPRFMTVLNMANAPGGLSQSFIEQAIGVKFDAVIPNLPRIVPKATTYGTPAASLRGPFRNAIADLANAIGATVVAEGASAK
jgi:pilus assembly protein CpaE